MNSNERILKVDKEDGKVYYVNPISIKNLRPVKKGEVRNPKGRPKGRGKRLIINLREQGNEMDRIVTVIYQLLFMPHDELYKIYEGKDKDKHDTIYVVLSGLFIRSKQSSKEFTEILPYILPQQKSKVVRILSEEKIRVINENGGNDI
ncbi:MAG TPA: hypothetical protein VK705_07035 [Ferruginibacter sp.]|jgi:hypothetical protein|nr:hypothetical protein [Ferruginibacter sp.]